MMCVNMMLVSVGMLRGVVVGVMVRLVRPTRRLLGGGMCCGGVVRVAG